MPKHSQYGDANKDPIRTPANGNFLVVGIGASAGGLQALKTFFSNLPKNSGNAYVVILHLSPDYDSRLAEILQNTSSMPVKQVGTRRVRVKPDHVYVISPNNGLEINDGYLVATQISSQEERRAPVDIFFRTLAESHNSRAVSVILSGTGPNGSMGIKRVKEKGGVIFVQDPDEAEYPDMPRNSIATGLVDRVLPVADIPARIAEYKVRFGKVEIVDEPEPSQDETDERALSEINTLLRSSTGHDFSNYKRSTVLRRIARRMSVHGKMSLPDYVSFLCESGDEAQALLKDLLISVTNFFRDAEPFRQLQEEIIPRILADKNGRDYARVWVTGCATGEEAYSIAMLFAEQLADRLNGPLVQIFATDIDEAAIAHARFGIYTKSDVADVSSQRLQHFFQREGENFRVRREIRETVLFALHDIVKDPPFSRLDMVSCRNLLIYLNRAAQNRVVETSHFALRPGGYLFLGSSESVDADGDLFVPVSKENRIFQSRAITSRLSVPAHELSPALLHQQFSVPGDQRRVEELRVLERLSYTALHHQLLEQYAPPSIVVNADYDIVHLSERAGRYLQIAGGEPSKNLLHVARPELRLELRTALYQAIQRSTAITVAGLGVRTEKGHETINILVKPVTREDDPNRGFILVIFEPAAEAGVPAESLITGEPVARQLEQELVHTRTQLRATIEQYEVQHEELRASNEELQAINEELRSAAEEIETSKEELQSVNEELTTVNQELKIKIEELSQANNDFQNLINSTQVGVVFLDRQLRVKLFTQAASEIFNLIPGDIGRPLSDLNSRLDYSELIGDVEAVLRSLQPVEREMGAGRDTYFLMRILPYRTAEDRIDGVVMTFIDITGRRRTEEDLRRSRERLEQAMNVETFGVIFFNNDVKFVNCNDTFLKMTGYTRDDIASGKLSWEKMTPPEWRNRSGEAIGELRQTGRITPYEKEYFRKDGSRFYGLVAAARVSENEIVEYVIDITSQKQTEKDLNFRAMLLENVEQSVIATDLEGKVTYWNRHAESMFGWKALDAIGRNILSLTTPKPSADDAEQIMNRIRQGKSWNGEFTVRRRDGSTFLAHVFNSPITDEKGSVIGVVGVSIDISERKRTETALRESDERLRLIVESATDYAIFTISKDNIIETWSPGAEKTFGYTESEIKGRSGEILFTAEDRANDVPRKEMECALETGKAEDERWHVRKDGSQFYASGVMQPLSDGSEGYVKICRDQTAKIKAETALREKHLLKQLVTTQEDERRRIARDLHDHLGQQMTSLRLKLEAVRKMCADVPVCREIEEVQRHAEQLDRDVDFLAWEIRPAALDDLGLRSTLGNFVKEWSRYSGIVADFHAAGLTRNRLSFEIETNLYRIGQEALNNVYKHANAKRVSVLLEKRGDHVVMIVEDDGVGFDPAGKKRGGLGLGGMHERAAIIGGTLEIESARGKGTTIFARVPLNPAKRKG